MIAWFARNDVAANLLMVTLLVVGLLSLNLRIPLEVFPTLDPEQVNVEVSLRGATPEDVEQSVAILIEEAVQDLEGIEQITSRSGEGSATVGIEIDSDYDPRELLTDIKGRVDAINSFPADADKPVVSLVTRRREVISVAISGPYPEQEIRQLAEQVRDDLLRLPDITQVELDSVRAYEIAIEVSEQRLRQYGITLQQVAEAVRSSAQDIAGGNIKAEGGEILIRSKGKAYHRHQFDSIPVVTNADGSVIRLADLAQVTDGFEESPMRSRFNGRQAAFVDVYRVGTQSAIDVADQVKDYIAGRQASLPRDIELTTWRDRSRIVKKRLQTLTYNAIQGGALVLLLLTLFLRPSIAFWVFIGIPVSFMGAFVTMPAFGVTLNIFSLFAFLLVLGIVVDDAIVTGENVYNHLRHAENGLQAAISGTREVAIPVTFGILTTIAAFLPLAFIEGHRGVLFAQIPVVVVPILLFSLIESKFVLPAHLKHVRIRSKQRRANWLERFQQGFADGFERLILRFYRPVLRTALANPWSSLVFFSGVLVLMLALIFSGWSKFTFWPRVQSELARAMLTMPAGTPFDVTDKYIRQITDAAFRLKRQYAERTGEELILNIQSTTGASSGRTSGQHTGRVMFEIRAPEERISQVSSSELVREWRKMIGLIPGAESLSFRAEIGRVYEPIDIQFSGNDLGRLSEVADKVKLQLRRYPAVFDIEDSLSNGKEELQLELRDEALALGFTRSSVLNQIRHAFHGFEVQRIQRGRDDVRVMVRYPANERTAVASLAEKLISNGNGQRVPLGQVVELVPGKSPSSIIRIDRYRTVKVTADVNKATANMTLIQAEIEQFLQQLLAQYPAIGYEFGGEAKEQSESFGSMGLGLTALLFIIYALLAIPFKSYVQPFIVMSVIPFGAIGALGGHWLMNMELTMLSMLGMMALVGVVVNDSLVLVDFINKYQQKAGLRAAILAAGVARFRPVMLTSLTTFIGLMPLLFEQSTQAQFLKPMAVSLGFGVLFATLTTLLLVPVNYMLIERARTRLRRWLQNDGGSKAQPPENAAEPQP
ncbi:MAG: efflux RND transporter permease subunit [Gammaproteobacteria bacterium]|nr:efflux RND transporter permease subunit [Gammaproteobacteria bacterium]